MYAYICNDVCLYVYQLPEDGIPYHPADVAVNLIFSISPSSLPYIYQRTWQPDQQRFGDFCRSCVGQEELI